MRVLSVLILLISCGFFHLACSDSVEIDPEKQDAKTNTSFRQSTWGMTPDEVKLTEEATPIKDSSDLILYQETFLDLPAKMGYIFKDGKLIKAAYLFEKSFDNPDDYITTYEKIQSSLINDFGSPSLDDIKWLDKDSDGDEVSGELICKGKVKYITEWVLNDTLIALRLEGDNNKCRQGIIFESKSNYFMELQNKKVPEENNSESDTNKDTEQE